MASYTRSRSYVTVGALGGTWFHPVLNRWTSTPARGRITQSTVDVLGNRKGVNPFDSIFTRTCDVNLEGRTVPGYWGSWIFENTVTTAGGYEVQHPALWNAVPTPTELQQYGLDVVAKTNPNAPEVSIPTALGELRELPSLVRSFGASHLKKTLQYRDGQRFAREGASRYLQWRWGIAPMLNDLKKLVDFGLAVEKRLAWFRKLASGKALHRRVNLDQKASMTSESNLAIWSNGPMVYSGPRTTVHSQKTWGSAQWGISNTLRFPWTYRDQLLQARRAVYGMTPQALSLAAWELMPWSWLIDWFTNFGALFGAVQNTVPVIHSKLCVMRETRSIQVASPYISSPASWQGVRVVGTWYAERRTRVRRTVVNPSPVTISLLPLLEGDKWSILGSLAVARRRS